MQLGQLAGMAPLLVAAFVLGCSPDVEPPTEAPPDLDTLRAALSERDELERTYLLTRYLRELGPDDIPGALAEVERYRVGITADEARLFMLAWTRFDGPGAFETARAWPTRWKDTLTQQAIRAWGFNDGRAAHAMWEGIEDEELKSDLREHLVAGWEVSEDRKGAAEFGATIEQDRIRSRLILRLTGQTMRDGPDAVIAWADSVPTDAPNGFKKSVFRHAVAAVARVDPERAAHWYERQIEQPYSRGSLQKIAGKWAQHHDPVPLAVWLENLALAESREAERVDAIRAAMRHWAASDPADAETWLTSRSPSPLRDAAITEYAHAMIENAPEKSLEWIALIHDDAERRNNTVRSSRRWLRHDPETAKLWLEESDIPQAWYRQIMSDQPRRKPNQEKRKAGPGA